MKTKLYPLALFTTALFMTTFSEAAVNVPLTLKHATLFLSGAELQNAGNVEIPAGENELYLTGFVGAPDPATITLNVDKNITILSTKLQKNYLATQPVSEEVQQFLDEMEKLKAEQSKRQINLEVLTQEIAMLKATNYLQGGQNTLNTKQMDEVIKWVASRLPQLLEQKTAAEAEIKTADENIERLQRQIDHARRSQNGQNNDAASYVMVVKVDAKAPVSAPVEMRYVVAQAGWTPRYDVRVKDLNSPLDLIYRADVYQQTGVDWKDVKLTLSTATPYEGSDIPQLSPWRVDLYQTPQMLTKSASAEMSAPVVQYDSAVMGGMLMSKNAMKRTEINRDGYDMKFDVLTPQTIPSTEEDQNIVLKEQQLKATYGYVTAPKFSARAFLQAEIPNWDKLNLLSGTFGIYIGGNFVGSSSMSLDDMSDTLKLSLGEDKNIVVHRTRDQHVTSKPALFGNSIQQRFAYKIEVKNTRAEPVEIEVKDQLPVIANSAISLADLNYGNAKYNEETGELTWKVTLQPDEMIKLPFSFSLKYPKDRRLTGL